MGVTCSVVMTFGGVGVTRPEVGDASSAGCPRGLRGPCCWPTWPTYCLLHGLVDLVGVVGEGPVTRPSRVWMREGRKCPVTRPSRV